MTISLNPLFAPTIPDGGVGIRANPLFTNAPRDWSFGCNFNPLFSTERVSRTVGILLDPLFTPGESIAVSGYPINVAGAGFTAFMDAILGRTQPGALTIKLFVNDVQTDGVFDASAFTEMSGHGYAAKQLETGNWVIDNDPDGAAAIRHPRVTWTFTSGSPLRVYGYYVVDASGALRWSGRFIGTVMTGSPADTLTLVPTFSFEGR